MFDWISNLFMSSTASAALDAAIYSAGMASTAGMHQPEEPKMLKSFSKNK